MKPAGHCKDQKDCRGRRTKSYDSLGEACFAQSIGDAIGIGLTRKLMEAEPFYSAMPAGLAAFPLVEPKARQVVCGAQVHAAAHLCRIPFDYTAPPGLSNFDADI